MFSTKSVESGKAQPIRSDAELARMAADVAHATSYGIVSVPGPLKRVI